MKIDGDTTPLVPITKISRSESVQNPERLVKNPATNIAVERANQYIFLKQLRFIIYMRLGDTVYQP